MEHVKEKEEKEAKRCKRLADDFFHLLSSIKVKVQQEITPSSKWEDCKSLHEVSSEYSAIGEESSCKEIIDKHISFAQPSGILLSPGIITLRHISKLSIII
ncbi:pre-mRNA-processing protein 40A-like isoform X1 [Rosa rugosa]|uniref:pre-mRNA-processing protein 40A-like isoform X1 n=1 Tax=Rosa rugosa TaxID=74645 RepID=UPI002B417365|nr:pre-mRNA-processing protein 40A-like isoform X1 [Rosa rugosa]